MCLSVNLNYHKVQDNQPIALVAKQSLLVYKVLSSTDGVHYNTPFQYKSINFDDKNGMFFYETTKFSIFEDLDYDYNVTCGIHSFIDIDVANCVKKFFKKRSIIRISICYAIIPKGSKFYIGVDGDVVSNDLVVFESKTKYNKNKEYFGDEPIEFSEYSRKFGTELDSK